MTKGSRDTDNAVSTRTLLLMRHAKSDWDADYAGDHERPLNARGVRCAELMGRLLPAEGLEPGLVVSSTALRAQTTAQLAARAGSWASPIQLDRALYDSGLAGVIERAAEAPDITPLMLVGHQPTWSLLAEQLTGERVEMKTASVVVIDFALADWAQLRGAKGSIAGVYEPRSYYGTRWDMDQIWHNP